MAVDNESPTSPDDWILDQAGNQENIERAFDLLLRERARNESYCDWAELEQEVGRKAATISWAQAILKNPSTYSPEGAFLYSYPKDRFVSRRMVYRTFRDALVKYSLILPIADRVESVMIGNSFANRRAKGNLGEQWLLEPFMSHAVKEWQSWQATQNGKQSHVLTTDIAAFYDSVAHDHVLEALQIHAGVVPGSRAHQILAASMQPTLAFLQHHPPKWIEIQGPIHQGLSTGCASDAILANILLIDLDNVQKRHPKIVYGRYADDILAYGSWKDLVLFIRDISQLLASKSLNLSKGKTKLTESEITEKPETATPSLSEIGEAEIEYDAEKTDPPTSEFDCPTNPTFQSATDLEDIVAHARDFCKFLSYATPTGRALSLEKRIPNHVAALAVIIEEAPHAAKHAAWLLIESIVNPKIQENTCSAARSAVLTLLGADVVHPYAKQRILHHLLRPRDLNQSPPKRWVLEHFSPSEREALISLTPSLASSEDLALQRTANYLSLVVRIGSPTGGYRHER